METLFGKIIYLVFSALFGLLGWLIKRIYTRMDKHEEKCEVIVKSISDHKLHAAETYATKADVNALGDRILDKLDKIDDKLDKKVDK